MSVEYVWLALLIAVMAGLWWVAYRMEPHWSSRDGHRFLCMAQDLPTGFPPGRPRETRVSVLDDGALVIGQKRSMRRRQSIWTLEGKAGDPPPRREVFVARERVDGVAGNRLALRLPADSRSVAVLDGLLEQSAR